MGLTGLDHTPTAAGKEAVEVDEGEGGVLGPTLGGVPGGERAEEGVGQQAGSLPLGHGDLVGLLLPQEGDGVGHCGGQLEGQVDDPGEEGGEEHLSLLLPAVGGEVVMEVVKLPPAGITRVVDKYRVHKLVRISDGLC